MMTSRAEYRLLLRQDNADLRLRDIGYRIGLVSEEEYQKFSKRRSQIEKEVLRMKETVAGSNEFVNSFLRSHGSAELKDSHGVSFASLIRRPELNYELLSEIDPERPALSWRVREQVNIQIRYEGYIEKQKVQVEHFKKLESRLIPEDIDYDEVGSLRIEALQKLKRFRPHSLGQAGRIAGVSPADVAMLNVYLEQKRRENK